MNLLEAESAASAASHSELLDRKTSLLEIMSARAPFYMGRFFKEYEDGNGYQKLLDFILKRIKVLKTIQMPTQQQPKPQTTEAEQAMQQQQQPNHCAFTHQTQSSQKCLYCKNHHDTSMCDRLFCLSLEDRVAAISNLRLCYHCFLPHHTAKSCPQKREVTCSTCARKGHATLFHGRHLLHSPNGSPNRHRQNEVEDDNNDDDKSVVEMPNESNAQEENEPSL